MNVGGSLTPEEERVALQQAMRLIAAWSSERGELFAPQSSQVINEIFQGGGAKATARLDSLLRTFAALTSTAVEYSKDLSELKDPDQRLDTLERAVARTIEERRRRGF